MTIEVLKQTGPRAALRNLFSSRKFITTLVGTISAIGLKLGLQLDDSIVALVVALFAAMILGTAHEDAAQKRATVIGDPKVFDAVLDPPVPPNTFRETTTTTTVGPADGGGT